MEFKKRYESNTLTGIIAERSGISIDEFLHPDSEPFLYGLKESVEFIKQCIQDGSDIHIFADYDCDGIMSGSILFRALSEYLSLSGKKQKITIRFPKRFTEGYGISESAVNEFDHGLLITVDNGITAIDPIQKAKEKGMHVVVFDHHLAGGTLPSADVIVDPHIETKSDFSQYCGAGIAFRFAKEILPKESPILDKLLVLAGIATVADMVPLYGANRYLVQQSLQLINSGIGTDGLRALLRMLNCGSITEETYGYLLGPVCNASGRILDDGAKDVFQLIVTDLNKFSVTYDDDFFNIHEKAKNLIERNEKRKEMTNEAFKEIHAYLNIHEEILKHSVLVVRYGSVESLGIIGLVAGELAEIYQKPAFVFAKTANPRILSGSARTYGKVHLKEEILDLCNDVFISYGGHAEAAGAKIYDHNLTLFQKKADTCIPFRKEKKVAIYDMEKKTTDIQELFREEKVYAPYGVGNEKPVYLIKNYILSPVQGKFFEAKGRDKKNLKLYNEACNAYGFNLFQKYVDMGAPRCMDLLVRLKKNEFHGKCFPILDIIDFSNAETERPVSELQKQFSDLLNFTKEKFM